MLHSAPLVPRLSCDVRYFLDVFLEPVVGVHRGMFEWDRDGKHLQWTQKKARRRVLADSAPAFWRTEAIRAKEISKIDKFEIPQHNPPLKLLRLLAVETDEQADAES